MQKGVQIEQSFCWAFLSVSIVYSGGNADYSVKHLFLFELVHYGEEFSFN